MFHSVATSKQIDGKGDIDEGSHLQTHFDNSFPAEEK